VQTTPEREGVALERFARFFGELRAAFVEREDVLTQLALALLAKEHVLMTGPPGTGKSSLSSSLLGRIVCENTGEPSLFSRQLTESTVQTDLIGSVDFRTLTETGRTEHFTDEGMLGAVHAFLDEVLDGRDMLLRATLNLLEERELKQGTKTTKGQIECAVMTTNRYLSEALEEGRGSLLAFVDRIAFVSFVPRGFAKPEHLQRVVQSSLAGGMRLSERLTIQDLDVLQEMVDGVHIPPEVSSALVDLARRFDAQAHALERADPTFARTRYLSTRAVIRLGRLLRAIVVLDRATARRERSLVAEGGDLALLRLGLMLVGAPLADLDALLEQESEPRERRQLHIMKAEAQIFRDVLRDTPPVVVEEAERVPVEEPLLAEDKSPTELVSPILALLEAPGDLSSIRRAHAASVEYEREHPSERSSSEAMRGHLLTALVETVAFAGGPLEEHLSFLEEAVALKELVVATETSNVAVAEVDAGFAAAIASLGARYEERSDEKLATLMTELLDGPIPITELLASLRPLLLSLQEDEQRYLALAPMTSESPSFCVAKRRVVRLLHAAYQRMHGVERSEISTTLEKVMRALKELRLVSVVPAEEHLRWIASTLVSDDAPTPVALSSDLEGYRAHRAHEHRTPMSVSLVELLTILCSYEVPKTTPGLESMAARLSTLPESLRDALARVDLARIERSATLLEEWLERDPSFALTTVCFEEQALLRFCLECELLRVLFPHASGPAAALSVRLKEVGNRLRYTQTAKERIVIEERWRKLPS
jgi:MoxR-like ATPase